MKKVLNKSMYQIIEEQETYDSKIFVKKIPVNGYWHHVRELQHSVRGINGYREPCYKGMKGFALFKITKMSLSEKLSNK